MNAPPNEPSWRKPAGALLIVALIIVWSALVLSVSPWIGRLPSLAQALVYLVLGLVWIAPLRPLLRWMELGRFR